MIKKLLNQATKAKTNAYAPYSNFKVGAAVLLADDFIISGCNVENASYGLSICAERSALFSAYNKGYKKEDIKAMAIISDSSNFISPCGACRQVMIELMELNVDIYLLNDKQEYRIVKVSELLPFAFKKEDLNEF